MTRTNSRLLSALLLCCGAGAAQAEVVISQVYGGGGNSGATFRSDFIELHNNGDLPVDMSGWTVQYASTSGTTWQLTALEGTIAPGAYYLVKQADGTGGTQDLPTPDATGTIAMAGANGKVALVEGAGALSGACPTNVVDLVGYGTANCFEGAGAAPALTNTTAALRAGEGCTDTNNNAADFTAVTAAPRNTASVPNVCSGGGTLFLSITDASGAEGDSGTTPFFVTVSLNQPAGPEGVSFTYTTADGTATVAGNDYVARSGTISFEEGQRELTLSVDVLGDETVEPDEVFYINLGDVSGAEVAKGQAVVTILNDDVTTLAISAIQGSGERSPVEGQLVATTGIVTGRKNNGFFIQTADGEDDGDPATSEGLFVFTGGAPSADVAVGNRLLVQGTVLEFVPTADPLQLPLTQITNASVVRLSEGNPLPAAIALTNDMPNATGGLGQLEHLEGMHVTAPSFTVVAPTTGNTNEAQASGSSNGRFAVVVTGTARPFREPGIQIPNPDPVGSSAPSIPCWDFNPELIAVNSTTIGAPTADLAAGCRITGGSLTGPLDYTFRRYTIYPEGALTSDCTGAGEPRPSMLPGPDHVTFATYNLQRFFDTVNDANSGPTLTPAALERRLSKASIGIRAYLHTPDVVGVTEVENLSVLTTLANRINADAVTAGQPNPGYVAYLEEGFDVGGIDVGFLVKTASVGSVARVAVGAVEQVGTEEVLTNPNGSTSVLNDRPPLVLDAVAHFADGRRYPFTAIVVHQRSLSGIEDDAAGSNGWATAGQRVRDKRQKQADYLATLIDGMQKDDPAREIVVLGDFNAFEFNDGLVDAMGTVTGLPSPDSETAVDNDGNVLVAPSLLNTTLEASAEERYSFVFDYQAQSLDHVLVNQALVDSPMVVGLDISHARINADFPEVARNDAATPTRLSDHDPTVLLVRLQPATVADLGITVAAANAEVFAGDTLAFTATLVNTGPDAAQFPGFGAALDVELDDLQVTPPADWSCDAPAVADGRTTLSCSSETLANAAQAVFALSAVAPDALIGETVTLTVAGDSQTQDPEAANDSATAAVSIVEDPATAAQPLVNGVQVGGIEGAAGESRLFRIDVPAGARNLRILTAGGTGDVSLYASHEVLPTVDAWQLRSQRPGNNETVTLAAPQAGTWYVRVVGTRAFGRLTVRASYTP